MYSGSQGKIMFVNHSKAAKLERSQTAFFDYLLFICSFPLADILLAVAFLI